MYAYLLFFNTPFPSFYSTVFIYPFHFTLSVFIPLLSSPHIPSSASLKTLPTSLPCDGCLLKITAQKVDFLFTLLSGSLYSLKPEQISRSSNIPSYIHFNDSCVSLLSVEIGTRMKVPHIS